MVAIRYASKLGPSGSGGDWDLDTAVIHGVRPGTGRTLCGVRIGRDIRDGGNWERDGGRLDVTCSRCVKLNRNTQ